MFGYTTIIKLFCCAFLSLVAVQWIYFRILKIAKLKHLEDVPDARKLQKQPTPFLDGLAVFFGLTVGLIKGVQPNNVQLVPNKLYSYMADLIIRKICHPSMIRPMC